MSLLRLITRSLSYYRRTGVVVVFGLAVATAVIVGSLMIEESVKGSIGDTALSRLGMIDHVLVSRSYFRAQLAGDLAKTPGVKLASPVIITRGSAKQAESEVVLPNVSVLGVGPGFWKLFPDSPAPKIDGRQVAINAALAKDLGVKVGDGILLNVEKQGAAPSGTLFEKRSREDTVRTLRVTVTAILPDRGVGGFSLDAGTKTPRNVFVHRLRLLGDLDNSDRANAVLIASESSDKYLQAALDRAVRLPDYGLRLVTNSRQDYVSLQSSNMVLGDAEVRSAKEAAVSIGARPWLTSVYLATTIKKAGSKGRGIAYSVLAGLEPHSAFPLRPGSFQKLDPKGIWLNRWAAADLKASIGDTLEVEYLIPSDDGVYRTGKTGLILRGIVEMTGPAADRGLVPEFQGITDARRIGDWNPPFPIDLGRVTARDEKYWDRYRTTPKAFVNLETARRMWSSGSSGTSAGWVTSIRLMPEAQNGLGTLKGRFERELVKRLSPSESGLVFRPVRKLALAASQGTTDFAQLFIGMSFFLVLAGAGLAATLMRLSADRRAAQVGTMLATGFAPRAAAGVILGEGLALALLGALAGVPLGLLYAWGIISALTSWWIGAVGTPALWLHVESGSLAGGGMAGFVIGAASMAWAARGLSRSKALELLSGRQSLQILTSRMRTRRAQVALAGLLALAALLVVLSTVSRSISPTAAFFGSGAALLAAGLVAGDLVLTRAMTAGRGTGHMSLAHLAIRNVAANRRRSLLVVGLLASASFIVVAVAANTRDFSRADVTAKNSGAGGFSLMATSSLPLHYGLDSSSGRKNLGFSSEDESAFAGVTVIPFLISPGEDISCLNLARPSYPRVLGVPHGMVERGGFGLPADRWSLLEREDSGPIPIFGDADSVQWTVHSGLGQMYSMPAQDGMKVEMRFVGLIPSSIFASELLMSENNFRRVFPSVAEPRFFLIDAPRAKASKVAEALRSNLGDMGVDVRTTGEVLNSYTSVQNTYLSMFLALGGLGIILGTVGLVAVLLRSVMERRGEFALMLATGFSREDLARLLVAENAGLLAAGVISGTVCALVAVAPEIASTTSGLSWGPIVLLLVGILAIGLTSCRLAAKAAVRGPLIEALRGE